MARFSTRSASRTKSGLITAEQVDAPDRAKLAAAAEKVQATFPADDVDLYLKTLLILDGETWGAGHAAAAGQAVAAGRPYRPGGESGRPMGMRDRTTHARRCGRAGRPAVGRAGRARAEPGARVPSATSVAATAGAEPAGAGSADDRTSTASRPRSATRRRSIVAGDRLRFYLEIFAEAATVLAVRRVVRPEERPGQGTRDDRTRNSSTW